jgi:5-methylcytosine-specific restriction enzyme A
MKLSRDPFCEDCLEQGILTRASQVDHIDGDNTNDDWDNLRSLCATHHSIKKVKHDHGFGR